MAFFKTQKRAVSGRRGTASVKSVYTVPNVPALFMHSKAVRLSNTVNASWRRERSVRFIFHFIFALLSPAS